VIFPRFISALAIILLAASAAGQEPTRFCGERIDFTLDRHAFGVRGLYTFVNTANTAVRHEIVFPFPSMPRGVRDLSISNASTNEPIRWSMGTNEVRFELALRARDTVDVSIAYRQKASKRNVYILTSTRTWRAPLTFAAYSLTAEKDAGRLRFSYEPDSAAVLQHGTRYYWFKKGFLPERDFEVTRR
jgi:hypothetical protein